MNGDILIQFLNDPDWDAPFFKRLPKNDSGDRESNQAGFVVVRDLRPFFPDLDAGETDEVNPTVDRFLQVEMFLATGQVGFRSVRYQFQTWGGTRTPEARATDGTQVLLDQSHTGDLLVMQRSRDRLDSYRFLLVRTTDVAYTQFSGLAAGRRWGPLFTNRPPVSQQELMAARAAMLADAAQPFVATRTTVPRVPTTRSAIARDTAFRATLLVQYRRRCAVSGIALATRTLAEAEAAHVIPLDRGGPDEPRNGITLTGTLHWAFDRGLFGVSAERRVIVPGRVRAMPENAWLVQFDNRAVDEANTEALRTATEAFAWHRANLLAQWS